MLRYLSFLFKPFFFGEPPVGDGARRGELAAGVGAARTERGSSRVDMQACESRNPDYGNPDIPGGGAKRADARSDHPDHHPPARRQVRQLLSHSEGKLVGFPHLGPRYRKGYVDQSTPPQDEGQRRAALHDAVLSPMDANGIGLRANVRATGAGFDATLRVDPKTILLDPQGDRWTGKLDLLFVEKDEHGMQTYGERRDPVDGAVMHQLHAVVILPFQRRSARFLRNGNLVHRPDSSL